MRLKEIKPGMVIHCKTLDEMKQLIEFCNIDIIPSMIWNHKLKGQGVDEKTDCLRFDENGNFSGFDRRVFFENEHYKITEFSDLIIRELTAEETIKLHTELCCGSCEECPLYNVDGYSDCEDLCINNPEKAVEILAHWKSEHEKKEPEIEWVYRVFGAENYGEKFFQTEEEAIKRCEELAKSQKTKQYARYERVCRVKAVE